MRLLISFTILILLNKTIFAQHTPSLLPAPKKIEAGNGLLPLKKLVVYEPASSEKDVSFALNELIKNVKERTGISLSKTNIAAAATLKYTIVQKKGYCLKKQQ